MYPCTSWHIIWMKYHILQLFISQLHSAAASEVNNGADKQPMMEELQRRHRGTSSDKTPRGRRRRLWKAAGIWTDSMMDTPRWQRQPHSVLSAFFKRWQILDILCKKPQSSLQHWHFSVCVRDVSPLCGFVFQQGPSLRLVWLHLFGCLRVTQTLTDSKLYYVQQRPVRHTQDVFT